MDEQRPTSHFEGHGRPPATDPGRFGTIVFGLALIGVGLWFFADRTLGLDLPRIDWGSLWPLMLIVLGGWVLLGARGRRP